MSTSLLKTSVRELVSFVLRSGDLVSGGFASPDRLVEGTRGHQRLQNTRPEHYQSEVAVSYRVEVDDLVLEINGRIDGLLIEEDAVLVEEIKTTTGELDPDMDDVPTHWAQAKVYACILAIQKDLDRVDVQLTYVQLESMESHEDRRSFERDELIHFFEDIVTRYLHWARIYHEWSIGRDESIETLQFPFVDYRPGQRQLAVATYRAIENEGRIFAQAPTGIGKTISTLFPAVKALGLHHVEKLFYLTAKTIGRTVAEKAVNDMRAGGAQLKSLTLTARDKICFKPNGGTSCDPEQCSFAIGYFDRIGDALEDIFQHDAFTRPLIEEYAQKHSVCPFEFSLDLSLWSDIIICDYNYVFDPRAHLKRFFADGGGRYAFLVDEAHNLVDRAREMFSAELYKSETLGLKRLVSKDHPTLGKILADINSYLLRTGKKVDKEGDGEAWITPKAPEDLLPILAKFLKEAEKILARGAALLYWDELIEYYFTVVTFARIAELFDEHYTTYAEKQNKEVRLRLYNIDPAKNIREALKRGTSAAFFSATLTPLDYFSKILGGEKDDPMLSLDSPFPHDNLRLLLADQIETTYKKRDESYGDIAESIAAAISQHTGNYLVFFPSYRYMAEVSERFVDNHPDVETLVQETGMSEREREAFLAVFEEDNTHTTVAFAVMGGIFGEGIDLVGERLVGAIIVGVGLPQICLERDLIRHYFDERDLPGFDYAYTFPGMNRVLQAAGRVIRTDVDRGIVLLVDRRFGQQRYRRLFPPFWHGVRTVRGPEEIGSALEPFWPVDETN
ncbi:MAG: DNA excision repair protein ERCC-2 [Candidatus Latescibacterota bacterium]|jgi:DNA excision repair protein ERCC-2